MELILNKKIGQIYFGMNISQVKEVLGIPDIYNEHLDPDYSSVELRYEKLGCVIFFEFENNKFANLSVHLNACSIGKSLLFVGQDYNDKLNECVKQYHSDNNVIFAEEIGKEDIDRMYNYPNIGLTLWVENGKINDIQVEALERESP